MYEAAPSNVGKADEDWRVSLPLLCKTLEVLNMKVVTRFQGTRYSRTRGGREKFEAVFNNVSLRRVVLKSEEDNDILERLNVKETRMINLCDVRSMANKRFGNQEFKLSDFWKLGELARGQRVTFTATIYRLKKVKRKNGHKPGPTEMFELGYPSEIQIHPDKDKSRLTQRGKDQLIDYRRKPSEDTILDDLISKQIAELASEHDYATAKVIRSAQETLRRKSKVLRARKKRCRNKSASESRGTKRRTPLSGS